MGAPEKGKKIEAPRHIEDAARICLGDPGLGCGSARCNVLESSSGVGVDVHQLDVSAGRGGVADLDLERVASGTKPKGLVGWNVPGGTGLAGQGGTGRRKVLLELLLAIGRLDLTDEIVTYSVCFNMPRWKVWGGAKAVPVKAMTMSKAALREDCTWPILPGFIIRLMRREVLTACRCGMSLRAEAAPIGIVSLVGVVLVDLIGDHLLFHEGDVLGD
ncbi:hypothetical protein FB451DRAFT_1169625 [Mycena latifolia]|nr:hypothetical protein FB451DRAFT_1169625 [Mycena latifolia]